MNWNYSDDYQLNSYYRYMEDCDESAMQAYNDYPEIYDNHHICRDEAYEHGAECAYKDNPQRLMNHLIGCVL